MSWIQLMLTLWLIERVSIERPRYKLAIDTGGQFWSKGYWAIWIYERRSGGDPYYRYRRLIHFKKYIIPCR